jgi:CHAD domain-containing protein
VSERMAVPQLTTVREAARAVITRQVRALRRQERAVARAGAPDPIHDMRVATRRLRAALAVFRSVVVLPKAARRPRLRWLARQLGRVRDLDVRTALLAERYLPAVAGQEAARVDRLVAECSAERHRAHQRLRKGLARPRYRKLRTALGGWVRHAAFADGEDTGAARFVAEAVDRAAQRVGGHEAMHDRHPTAAALHDLRIAVKRLRYTLDFHADACGLAFDAERAVARDLQDCLGEMRDHDLLFARLAEDGAGTWPQLSASVAEGRMKLWRRFLQIRRRWLAGTRPAPTVAPLEEPRFVHLEVTPVQLRLVSAAVSRRPSAVRTRPSARRGLPLMADG